MKQKNYWLLGKLTAALVGGAMLAPGMAAAQEQVETAGTEVLTRGPIHEAFAGTVSFNPEVGIIVDQAPPALIEEVPPEQRLDGDNVSWIPGYWAWDEDQSDFLWISGIWRNLPPGRQWVPGYWAPSEGQYQWTSGYWEDAEATEVTYLPQPPKSVEVGPNIEAPSNDQTWIPGNWRYQEDRYAWSAGYWAPARQNWSWTPSYYRWSNRGYVYVDGYWDYPVVNRGVVFAPVRFDVGYRSRPDFYYTPSSVISLSVFANHLFLRPNYGHYYYGDYYEPRYRDRGFYASYSYNSSRYGYDPIYSHYRWENRNDRNWEDGRRDYYEYRRDNQDARPPRDWASMSARRDGDRNRDDYQVAQRFDKVVSNRDGGQRFKAVDKSERDRYVAQRQDVRKFGKEREQLETRGERVAGKGDKERASVIKEKVNRSPVVAKKSDRSDKDGGPPARLQARASDNNKDQKSDKSERSAANGKDSTKNKRDNGDKMDPGSNGKGKSETATESRVKPGEKREKEPGTQGKDKREGNPDSQGKDKGNGGDKRQADPTPDRKANGGEKRQADPTPDRKANGGEKRQADPTPDRKANGGEKRQSDPTPDRKANGGEKRQADPTPDRKANGGEKRQADPTPDRKVNGGDKRQADPTPKRQADPTPERKANPAPKREAQPAQERKAKNPDEARQSAPAPARREERQATAQPKPAKQAQREQASSPQQKPKSQQTAEAQRSAPKQQAKAQPAARPATDKTAETAEEKKKRKQAE